MARNSAASFCPLALLVCASCGSPSATSGDGADGSGGITPVGETTATGSAATGPDRTSDTEDDTTGTSAATDTLPPTGTGAIMSTTSGDDDDDDDDVPAVRFDVLEIPDIGAVGDTGDCGGELFGSMAIPPNILIVLDRSLSMQDPLDEEDDDSPSKWDIAIAALEDVTTTYAEQVRFGLMLFPGEEEVCVANDACVPGGIFIDPAPDTATAIQEQIDVSGACALGTPIGQTIEAIVGYEGLQDPERPNFVLLITDGRPQQCGAVDLAEAVTAVREQPQEVRTFVVGFGGGVDPEELSAMAIAGGTAIDDDPVYYQADNAAALSEAFAEIAGSIVSCDFALEREPPDINDLYAFFDTTLVERDPTQTDGWDYDRERNQITFFGPACEAIQTNAVGEVSIVFGCPVLPEG